MATNKHAQIRYNVLDRCFSNRFKKYFLEDLIKQCSLKLREYYSVDTEISRRQIFEDIRFMESEAGYSAPIEKKKDGRRVYYSYSEVDFSIHKKALSPSDEAQLKTTLQAFNRMNQLPGFEWLHEVSTKLEAGLNLQQNTREIMHFESNDFLKGIEQLSSLYQYIIHQQSLLVRYQSFKAENASDILISPYYLKQYNGRWFLFGWNHDLNILQNLAVDRIRYIKAHKSIYCPPTIDFKEYFDDIVGVSNNLSAPVESIKIRLKPAIIPYIQSKPFHGSQKIRKDILCLSVRINYELESLILSYGENMTVLEPAILRKNICERIKSMTENYCAG